MAVVKAFVGRQKEDYFSTIFNYNDHTEAPTSRQSFCLLEEATHHSSDKEFCGICSLISVETMEIDVAFVNAWKAPIPFTSMNNFIFHFNSAVFFGHGKNKTKWNGHPWKVLFAIFTRLWECNPKSSSGHLSYALSLLLFRRVTTWVMARTHQNTI